MKVLVTGAKGQLGFDVVKELTDRNIENIGIDIDDVDITNESQITSYMIDAKPDAIIHCAAYTATDKAEDERELCYKINVDGTKYIAKACKKIDAKLAYISSDYVFDGSGDKPFKTTDAPNPINWYGKTKHEGELEVKNFLRKYFIIRTSWVFGKNGNNFVKTMLSLANKFGEVSVVNDQIGSPTYTPDLARLLADMSLSDKYGVYHATNEGFCSWYDFAVEIFKQSGLNVKTNSLASEQYPTKAKRPKNSRLDKRDIRENFYSLQHWKEALQVFLIS
jgi:dTDP-4-dehydrorhamnose reductase